MRIELLLFLSLMVMIIVMIACSAPRRPTPNLSPTLFPVLTLTTYDPQMIARVDGAATIAATISPPSASQRDIYISPPRCYRTAAPMLTCLGAVGNIGRKPFRDIMLRVGLRRPDGESLGDRAFLLEQRRIEAGSSAPYRFFAPARRDAGAAIDIAVVRAQPAGPAEVTLTLADERGEYLAARQRYRFSASVRNDSGQLARGIRLIVTLESADGAIVGYRAVDIAGELPIGEARPVDLTIATLGAEAPARHRATLEALPAAESLMPR